MVSLSTGPSSIDALGMGFGAQAAQVTWPKAVRSFLAVGSLGLLLGFGGVLKGKSCFELVHYFILLAIYFSVIVNPHT